MTICDDVKRDVGSQIISVVGESRREKVEKGMVLCKDDGRISVGKKCTGDSCGVVIGYDEFAYNCADKEQIGTIHTHPEFREFSATDLISVLKNEVACIAQPDNTLECTELPVPEKVKATVTRGARMEEQYGGIEFMPKPKQEEYVKLTDFILKNIQICSTRL